MSDRTIEQQIDDALIQAQHPAAPFINVVRQSVRQAMRDLLAGKFREAPLPIPIAPPWPHKSVQANHHVDGWYRVTASGAAGWNEYSGPARVTERAAIEAWNAVFAASSKERP